MPRILYIAYWGALEPLGRSLIVPAVIEMARLGATITLVTFEKPADLERERKEPHVGPRLKAAGVKWRPKLYHKTPKNPATAYDIAIGVAYGLMRTVSEPFDIVHGRCFVGGLIAMAVAKLSRKKFVYHNEGFYPDEQVDGGVWTTTSRSYRTAKYLEKQMYARADGIVVLSRRAALQISEMSFVGKNKPIVMVPSCVDLDHFSGLSAERCRTDDLVGFVYIGSVGDRYIIDRIGQFISAVNRDSKKATLSIYSKADPELVRGMLKNGGLDDDWSLSSVTYDEMPKVLPRYDSGLFFLQQGMSEHGCSPTKIGEYWASGIPVVTTPNVSDTDEIIQRYNVGTIIGQHTDESYLKAFDQLRDLLADPDLEFRCRAAALEHYALRPSCERQIDLYNRLINNN